MIFAATISELNGWLHVGFTEEKINAQRKKYTENKQQN